MWSQTAIAADIRCLHISNSALIVCLQLVYGEYSLKVAESMQNLATILDSQGLLIEAEKLLGVSPPHCCSPLASNHWDH